MSISPQKQSNVPNFQKVDTKGEKHKRQENVNKSFAARDPPTKGTYSVSQVIWSFMRESAPQDGGIQSMVNVPANSVLDHEDNSQASFVCMHHRGRQNAMKSSSHGKQSNLFYQKLQESSWYPSSNEETWIDSDFEYEESEEEETASTFIDSRVNSSLQREACKSGAHQNNFSLKQLKSSQMKRGISGHADLLENNSYFRKPVLPSTKISQNSKSSSRKNVKFKTNGKTSSNTDGKARKYHQGYLHGRESEILLREKEEAQYGESWYDQMVVGTPLSDEWTDTYSHHSEVMTFDDYSTLKSRCQKTDQRVGSEKPTVMGPDNNELELKDLLHHTNSLHSLDKKLAGKAVKKGSSKERDEVLSYGGKTKHFGRLETPATEQDSHEEGPLGGSQFEEDLSVFELDEIDALLQEEYKIPLCYPSNRVSIQYSDRGIQGSFYGNHTSPLGKGTDEDVDHLKEGCDLMSSLQNVDSVQDLLLQCEDLGNLSIPLSVEEFNENFKLGQSKSFPESEREYFDDHHHNSILPQFDSATKTQSLEIGLHDEHFQREPLQAQHSSYGYGYMKDGVAENIGSKHLQDFVTARDFSSEVSSSGNRVPSRFSLEEATVERMVSDVILSQSELMSQLVESSLNTSKSLGLTERSSMSYDFENSDPNSALIISRKSCTKVEGTMGSIRTKNNSGPMPSHHAFEVQDGIAVQTEHSDSASPSMSFPELTAKYQGDKSNGRYDLKAFYPQLERESKGDVERGKEQTQNYADSLLLSRKPELSSMDKSTDITAMYSMQKNLIFHKKDAKQKSPTSKHIQQLQTPVDLSNEESSFNAHTDMDHFPNNMLHCGMPYDKSSHQKSTKESLRSNISQASCKSTMATDHCDQIKLQEDALVQSGQPECIQLAAVSLESLKLESTSSKFNERLFNKSSNNANGEDHEEEASFHESELRDRNERLSWEIESMNMNLPDGMKSSVKSFTSESSFTKGNKFPTSSKSCDFTQSLHLSELKSSDVEGGGRTVDEADESRRENGKRGVVESESHVLQRDKHKYQDELWKMQYDQRGQYDQWKEMNKETNLEGETMSTGTFNHEEQYGSRTLFHMLPENGLHRPVRSAHSLPAVVESKQDTGTKRWNDVSKQFTEPPEKKYLKQGSRKDRVKKDHSGQADMVFWGHSRTNTVNRSLLQDVTLLSGLGWTTRVRNVLREIPKKKHGDMVSKAYWIKRWRISTRVQKMLRAEEEEQMQSAMLLHEVSLLHKYLNAWKAITRSKQYRASQFHRRYLLCRGMRALQTSVRERETKVKHLEGRIQQGHLRVSFLKWHGLAKLHHDNGLFAAEFNERNQLVLSFHKWKEKFGVKQKERISNLHYKLRLLSSHFVKWKVYISDRKVKQEQNEVARVFFEENTLQVSWETLKTAYHKRLAAQQQNRRCLLGKVVRSWRHGAKLSRLETIRDHHKAHEFRRSMILRTYLFLWREEVEISKARKKLDVVTLRFAFDLWKLKLERKNLVAKIVASKLRRAAKLRALAMWKKKTFENRERRIEGTRILEKFIQRHSFQAWKMFVKGKRELRSTALLWSHQSCLRSKMQVFMRWRRKIQEKQQVRALEEHQRQLFAAKYATKWKQHVKVKQDEVKVQIFQENQRLLLVTAAFSTWVKMFDEAVKDEQRAAKVEETLAQNKVHRTFLSWWLVAREGAVIKPLLQKRRLKTMSSIFTSWWKLVQQKKTAHEMVEQKKSHTLAMSYYAWRQQYLAILQQRIAVQTHERNHLQRVFRSWNMIAKRKKIAKSLTLECKEQALKRSFVKWKEKTEVMVMERERTRGNEAREIILKKYYFRLWLIKIKEQRDEEDLLCSRISVMQDSHLLIAAYCELKSSYHREIKAREYREAATNRKLEMILFRWHQYAKYSFQRSVELFTHSIQMTTSKGFSESESEISRLAAASESSIFSDTPQFSVVDSGYHGNHTTLAGIAVDEVYIQAVSDAISATEFSDTEIMSYQSFKTFSEENDNSVSPSPRHNGTPTCYEYSSNQSFIQMQCANSSGETIVLEGEGSKIPNFDFMIGSTTEGNNITNDRDSLNDGYAHTEEELVSSVTRNEFYHQYWSGTIQSSSNFVEVSSEPATSMKALSSSASSEAGESSSSSQHLCTVKYQSPESNALRDIWLRETGERSDGDSLGEMSVRELGEIGEEDGEEDSLQQGDGYLQRGTAPTYRAELLTYMIKFWRLWPASAAFLQWLAYVTYRKNERQKAEKFSGCLENQRLQKCFQIWKSRSELITRARNHEKIWKLRKHFGALRDYNYLQKKQREDEEVAMRWRYSRSLVDSFHHWKFQFLKTHAVGSIAPSWKEYVDKSTLLQVRAADWKQIVRSKNVKECFMFWKLRFWQQVQVRDYHERILKLRYFRAWSEWIYITKWRHIQQDKFLQHRQKSLALARWRKALSDKSKVEMVRSKVNQNHLREIVMCWHQYSRICRLDRVRTEEIQHIIYQGTLRQHWNVWRDCLDNLMKAKKHRDEILLRRSFVSWSVLTQHNTILQEAVLQVRKISQRKILKLSFTKWQQRFDVERKLALFMERHQLGLVKVYFMRWKEFMERRRQGKMRQRELMQQVITHWMSICAHGKRTRDLAKQSLHRWHQLVIRSQKLSLRGYEFTKRTNDRCLQTSWENWKDASQKWRRAKEFCEISSKKCFFTRWSSLTRERKTSLSKLDHFKAKHEKKLVVQSFQTWRVQFFQIQSNSAVDIQFTAQRSHRILAQSFRCWFQKFYENKAERYYQMSLERKVWRVWRSSQIQSQKVERFRNDCQKRHLQAVFRMLQKWTSDQHTRQKMMSNCQEKKNISCLREAFIFWKRQTNQLQKVDNNYHRHLLQRHLQAWFNFHRRKKQLNAHAVHAQVMFAFNQLKQSVPGSDRLLTLHSFRGNGRDVCNQRLEVCFKIWKMRLSVRDAEKQRLKLLTQRVIDRWRETIQMRRYQRQMEDELEELAEKYHTQRLRRAMFVAWRQETQCQKVLRERQEYLSWKFGNLWMKITSQRIIAEHMDHYWSLKKSWMTWRKVLIQSRVSKKFLEEDEASLCSEVFLAWKNAAKEGILSDG